MSGRTEGQIQPERGPKKAFGLALRDARKAKGFSQEKLALDCGLDRTFISLLERGVRRASIVTLFRIAEVLGMKPSELVQDAERRQ